MCIVTHWKYSMHKDHELTHRIVKDAQFFAGLKGIEREEAAHFAKGPYYAQNWEDATEFKPYVYMKVSEEGFELWKKAIQSIGLLCIAKIFTIWSIMSISCAAMDACPGVIMLRHLW